ncbi:MAG TPA: YafY family protein [Blastocatellia bacterium]|nr:YafY family protein [Blastocatellia bacterium]
MRADRLISILMLLQVHRRMTARELARRLEVSERTVHRDMDALSAAGIPVMAERGAGGGWMLLDEYRTNLTGLNREEIKALFLTRPSRLLADLGLGKASEAAFVKLLASLPATSRGDAEYARQRIHVDISGWRQSEEAIPSLPTIQEAVWQERKLRFTYGKGDDCSGERLVDPLGLVAKGSVWYLVASVDGHIRSYRVSRIHDPVITDEPAIRPEGFDLAAHWEESSAQFRASLPCYLATVRADPAIVPFLPLGGRFGRVVEVGQPDETGWVRVSLRFDVEEMACGFVLSFGPQIEVLEPESLREKVIEMARSVVEFYRQPSRLAHSQV